MAYANIRKLGGQGDEAEAFFQKAARLKTWFQQTWWSAEQDTYRVFHYPDGRFGDGAGREFILYFGVAAEGHPTRATVDHMLKVKDVNIEMRSYYPEIFFRYGEAAAGVRTLLELCDEHTERRNYPEVSFAVVGAMTQGLMGIEPDGRAGRVATLARLPEATAWARLEQVPVLNTVIGVKHQGLKTTEFQNTGTQAIVWQACFAGRHATLQVEGSGVPVERKTEAGRGESGDFSGVTVKVEPGQTWRASVP